MKQTETESSNVRQSYDELKVPLSQCSACVATCYGGSALSTPYVDTTHA